jgi:hypothetical protein
VIYINLTNPLIPVGRYMISQSLAGMSGWLLAQGEPNARIFSMAVDHANRWRCVILTVRHNNHARNNTQE